jgi:hypothetical protein
MSMSVWPHDTFLTPKRPIGKDLGVITCFVASPFEPRKRWDDLFQLVSSVAQQIGRQNGVEIKCQRSDNIASAGIIHPEIWQALRSADFVVCDVTGRNGNVVLELGIAAAWRRKEHVIILRESTDSQPHLFDINPARHLEYEVSFSGMQKLASELGKVIVDVLASLPFEDLEPAPMTLPFRAGLTDGRDAPELHTEDITHRRLLSDCLEFGSPLVYRYSWMSLGGSSLKSVRVKAEMRLTFTNYANPFMGIMIRGQSYFANFGHLVFVRQDGTIYLNVREDDAGNNHDEPLGKINGFDIRSFVRFEVAVDDEKLTACVNSVQATKRLADLPYVFSAGRVVFIAGHCRVGLRNVEVEALGTAAQHGVAAAAASGARRRKAVPSARKKRSPRRG